MAHSKAELLHTIERRLRQRIESKVAQELAKQGQPGAAVLLATEKWQRQLRQTIQQGRSEFKNSPLLLELYEVFCSPLNPTDLVQLDEIDKTLKTFGNLSSDKLKFVADHLSPKRSGPARATLADIDPLDLMLWLRVTERRRERRRGSVKAECSVVARKIGSAAMADSLRKRYQRTDRRFGPQLRQIFRVP